MRTPEEGAREIAARIRKTGRGFITMTRDELRSAFEIQKFTENQAEAVRGALGEQELFAYPHPYHATRSLRARVVHSE